MSSHLGTRGSTYIVLPSEYGPSHQTDINHTVFLDPLGRWSMILEVEAYWPRGQGGRPAPGPIGLVSVPVASGLF